MIFYTDNDRPLKRLGADAHQDSIQRPGAGARATAQAGRSQLTQREL